MPQEYVNVPVSWTDWLWDWAVPDQAKEMLTAILVMGMMFVMMMVVNSMMSSSTSRRRRR
jgi:hypothetical protein